MTFCKLMLDPSDTLLCGCYANLYRDQPPLKSTLFQLQVYANNRPLKISKWEMCIQLFLDLIIDTDKY